MIKRLLLVTILSFTGFIHAYSQISTWIESGRNGESEYFKHFDVGINAGSTGIGFELGTQINDFVNLRTGFDFVPHFTYDMEFTIQVGDSLESKYDKDGKRVKTKFDRMADYLEQITGLEVDDEVHMKGEPRFNNFKLIADVFPFQDKRWYFSAGFYLSSDRIAKAYNVTEDMASLMAVSIYNNIYRKVENGEELIDGIALPPDQIDRILNAGMMGMHVGDFKDTGLPYMMVPDENSMVKADLEVNRFKPYIGAGYKGVISENGKWYVSVNAGFLCWGGTADVYTHDGTEIVGELTNIYGQVDRYVDIIKPLKVYPILNAAISYRIF